MAYRVPEILEVFYFYIFHKYFLAAPKIVIYLPPLSGCSVARLSRLLWEQEAAGSNPATPTKNPFCFGRRDFLFSGFTEAQLRSTLKIKKSKQFCKNCEGIFVTTPQLRIM